MNDVLDFDPIIEEAPAVQPSEPEKLDFEPEITTLVKPSRRAAAQAGLPPMPRAEREAITQQPASPSPAEMVQPLEQGGFKFSPKGVAFLRSKPSLEIDIASLPYGNSQTLGSLGLQVDDNTAAALYDAAKGRRKELAELAKQEKPLPREEAMATYQRVYDREAPFAEPATQLEYASRKLNTAIGKDIQQFGKTLAVELDRGNDAGDAIPAMVEHFAQMAPNANPEAIRNALYKSAQSQLPVVKAEQLGNKLVSIIQRGDKAAYVDVQNQLLSMPQNKQEAAIGAMYKIIAKPQEYRMAKQAYRGLVYDFLKPIGDGLISSVSDFGGLAMKTPGGKLLAKGIEAAGLGKTQEATEKDLDSLIEEQRRAGIKDDPVLKKLQLAKLMLKPDEAWEKLEQTAKQAEEASIAPDEDAGAFTKFGYEVARMLPAVAGGVATTLLAPEAQATVWTSQGKGMIDAAAKEKGVEINPIASYAGGAVVGGLNYLLGATVGGKATNELAKRMIGPLSKVPVAGAIGKVGADTAIADAMMTGSNIMIDIASDPKNTVEIPERHKGDLLNNLAPLALITAFSHTMQRGLPVVIDKFKKSYDKSPKDRTPAEQQLADAVEKANGNVEQAVEQTRRTLDAYRNKRGELPADWNERLAADEQATLKEYKEKGIEPAVINDLEANTKSAEVKRLRSQGVEEATIVDMIDEPIARTVDMTKAIEAGEKEAATSKQEGIDLELEKSAEPMPEVQPIAYKQPTYESVLREKGVPEPDAKSLAARLENPDVRKDYGSSQMLKEELAQFGMRPEDADAILKTESRKAWESIDPRIRSRFTPDEYKSLSAELEKEKGTGLEEFERVNNILKSIPGGHVIKAVANASELPEFVALQYANRGLMKAWRGIYSPSEQRSFVIAKNLVSKTPAFIKDELESLIKHEFEVHFGFDMLLPDHEMRVAKLEELHNNLKGNADWMKLWNDRAKVYGDMFDRTTPKGRAAITEEAIARINENSTVFTEIVNWIKDVLEKQGLKFSDSELRNMLKQLKAKAREGEAKIRESEEFIAEAQKLKAAKTTAPKDPKIVAQETKQKILDSIKKSAAPQQIKQTAERAMMDGRVSVEEAKTIANNPAMFRDVFKISEYKKNLEALTPEELKNNYDPKTEEGMLAWTTALNKMMADGKPIGEILEGVADSASIAGRMLRIAQEFKTSTPEFATEIIDAGLRKKNRKLLPEDKAILQKAMQDVKDANAEIERLSKERLANPEDKNIRKELNSAKINLDDAMKKSANKIADYQTRDFADTFISAMQGGVLTLPSVIGNPLYNFANMFIMLPKNVLTHVLDLAVTNKAFKMKAKTYDPLDGIAYMPKGAWEGLQEAFKSLWQTKGEGLYGGERFASNRPIRSIQQAITGINMPKTLDGKVALADRLSKGIQGAAGLLTEPMLRLLPFGDKPFVRAIERMHLAAIGKQRGMSGKTLEAFIDAPDTASMVKANEAGLEVTAQGDTIGSMIVGKMMGIIENAASHAEEFTGLHATGQAIKIGTRATVPFARTLANIISQSAPYLLPKLAFVTASGKFVAAKVLYKQMLKLDPMDKKTAAKRAELTDRIEKHIQDGYDLIGSAAIGTSLYALAGWLLSRGAISGSADIDDEKRRSVQYAAFKPDSINLSALNRGDGEWRNGDNIIGLKALSIPGIFFKMAANMDYSDKVNEKKGLKAIGGESYWQEQVKSLSAVAPAIFDLSFAKTAGAGAQALASQDDKAMQRFVDDVSRTIVAPAAPNWMKNITKAKQNKMLSAKADSPIERMTNQFALSWGMFTGASNLLPSRDIFGRELTYGNSPWFKALVGLGVEKLDIDKPTQAMLDIYNALPQEDKNKVIPGKPVNKINFPDMKDAKLPLKYYDEYLQMVGEERLKVADNYAAYDKLGESLKRDPQRIAVRWQDNMEAATERGKRRFLQKYPTAKDIKEME